VHRKTQGLVAIGDSMLYWRADAKLLSIRACPAIALQISSYAIEYCFDRLFFGSFRTRLRGGFPEPEYLPAGARGVAELRYREDYARSALHEVAHWCVAGLPRHALVDFGYWYSAGERDLEQQLAFCQFEARPQALEWIFCTAAAVEFRPSLDNLSLDSPAAQVAQARLVEGIVREAEDLLQRGLSQRPAMFVSSLLEMGGGLAFEYPHLELRDW
jgi:elongation factor P hydroxylase